MRARVAASGKIDVAHEDISAFSAGSVVSNEPTEPRCVLGMKDAVLMIIGKVIVSGIFLVPGVVLRDAEGR
jgi:hypothetical protein